MKKKSARSRARSWTLHLLYAWEIGGREQGLVEHARGQLSRRRVSDRYRPYIDRLLGVIEEHLSEIDGVLQDVMPNWRLERLATVDRDILRIGAAEILFVDDVPGKVAIHEGIKLGEKYGSDDTPGFVNGVLDAVYHQRPAVT